MTDHIILLSIPGLRGQDLEHMPQLAALMANGDRAPLVPSFPCVTWPVQANMLTGCLPVEHGVTANGFYWRDQLEIEMWTAWNEKIERPQIWDRLHAHDPSLTSAVWFPMLSKGCGADYICMPAPIHNPDGSESLWCYSKPTEFYGELRDRLGHFPLQNFWGPLASIKASDWIVDSAVIAAQRWHPRFFFLYLPHLDYQAQKLGPDSPAAIGALGELDAAIRRLVEGLGEAYGDGNVVYLAASEYVITPLEHVAYPNRILREAGLLKVKPEAKGSGEVIDFEKSDAWALVDHQFSHIYVKDRDETVIRRVAEVFEKQAGIDEVLLQEGKDRYGVNHQRAGEVMLVSSPESWQAYYYWFDDARAPSFACTVDIHRKPGYDPVELHLDMATRSIPLDATLVKGSHGAPAREERQRGVLLSSQRGMFVETPQSDTDLCELVLRQFGI